MTRRQTLKSCRIIRWEHNSKTKLAMGFSNADDFLNTCAATTWTWKRISIWIYPSSHLNISIFSAEISIWIFTCTTQLTRIRFTRTSAAHYISKTKIATGERTKGVKSLKSLSHLTAEIAERSLEEVSTVSWKVDLTRTRTMLGSTLCFLPSIFSIVVLPTTWKNEATAELDQIREKQRTRWKGV